VPDGALLVTLPPGDPPLDPPEQATATIAKAQTAATPPILRFVMTFPLLLCAFDPAGARTRSSIR
jgi:hypothetical protein